ncbi:HmuY protein [Marivirga sericea]|uniref:HmuY protein n=1 Tax=Marivirga sericea TaxID=1028 RepID=A0A1X7LHK5_9BACT|nr:HmuY family protein [Marivirga sericea]SMG53027.1 HmuY protein [Marivirga sericea]
MNKISTISLMLLSFIFALTGCQEEEPDAPININFNSSSININEENQEAQIGLVFSRASNQAGNISVNIDNSNLVYGEENDFYTEPPAEGGELILNYESGQSEINFTIKAGSGLNIDSDEIIDFSINPTEVLQRGQNSSLTVAFSENFIAESGTIEMTAGGAEFTEQAFVDLSKVRTNSLDKNTWDLGFSTDNGFHVILNSTAQVMARPLDKTDLASVTAEDTVGFAAVMQIGFTATPPAAAWIDVPNGDLTKTAIAPIATTDADNKVYIIKRLGEGRSWKKVKITQNGDGYTIAYANIGSNDIETSEITKSESHNFIHFDLDNGTTDFEPNKESWDFMYGTFTEKFPFGPNEIPYSFNDFIIINRHNTSAAMVMVERNTTYADFNLQQIGEVSFNNEINAIGSSWRQGGGPSSAPAVFDDRFFIVKDSQENYYKIRFISMYDENNERGTTTFEFEILK